jgi:predicted dehydrogenase
MSVIEKSAPLRIAIIGAGYVSRHHIRALKQLDFVSIVGLADQQLDAAQSLAASSSIALACTTLEELLVLAPDCVRADPAVLTCGAGDSSTGCGLPCFC